MMLGFKDELIIPFVYDHVLTESGGVSISDDGECIIFECIANDIPKLPEGTSWMWNTECINKAYFSNFDSIRPIEDDDALDKVLEFKNDFELWCFYKNPIIDQSIIYKRSDW